ncbi:putative calcyphosin-2 [Apostichopus japonicus]|uniref:Putative calcyphosin-2 n=1 Tax=Stichopus japonicus TaxID=307972 RepID=A0A2G8LDZ9_STIJA|nr:putative calcyphosin-2 [Apostichopus japonicus]
MDHGRATSSASMRPDGVPSLNLGVLADRDNKLKNPLQDYQPKLSPPDTASTVSWGYHDHSPLTSNRETKRPPFALHHAPEATAFASGRSQRPASVPRLNLHDEPGTPKFQTPHWWSRARSPSEVDLERKAEALKLAESRKRDHIMQAVLTDQLSRAAISDPEQNHQDMPSSNRLHFGQEPKPKIRNLHYTKVRSTTSGTEQLLSNCINFTARILTRDGQFALRLLYGFYFSIDNSITVYEYRQFRQTISALPFVNRGSYSHAAGRRKGRKFTVQDISVGSDLSFETSRQGSLPAALSKEAILKLRIVEVDRAAKEKLVFQGRVPYDPKAYHSSIQQQIKKRASKTLTGLALHFQKLDRNNRGGKFTQDEIQQALTSFHISVDAKLFSSVWLVLDQQSEDMLTYSDFRRSFFGEMNEFRNSLVRKAFQKVDANKSGTISLNETRKFFCPHSHPLVMSGKFSEDEVKEDFYDLFNNRNREVSYGVFEDYHEGVSLNAKTDDEFAEIMKACWNL